MSVSFSFINTGGLHMSRGNLIVFEGLDGVGKSTQIRKLISNPNLTMDGRTGYRTIMLEYCFNSPLGRQIKPLLVESSEFSGDIKEQLALTARISDYQISIRGLLEQGNHVLMDRHLWSAGVYQGIPESVLLNYTHVDLAGVPDLTVYLHLPKEVVIERLKARGNIETIEADMINRIDEMQQRYEDLINIYQRKGYHVAVVDANRDADAVHEEVKRVTQYYLPYQ